MLNYKEYLSEHNQNKDFESDICDNKHNYIIFYKGKINTWLEYLNVLISFIGGTYE